MAQLLCEICGGNISAKSGGIFSCDVCGMEYSKERIQELVQGGVAHVSAPVVNTPSLDAELELAESALDAENNTAAVRLAREEEARIDRERKAEEDKIRAAANKKKAKKIASIFIPSLVAIAAIVILAIMVFIPNSKYINAVALMEAGQYEEAIAAFEAMDGYKDSTTQIEKCNTAILDEKYNTAIGLMNNGDYDGAIAVFNEIIDYKDSAELMHQCYGTIDTIYESAPILMPKQLTMDEVITLPNDIEVTFDSVVFSTEINERLSSNSTLSVAETINNDNTICALRFFVKNIGAEPYNTTLISDTLERGFYVDFDFSPTLIYADKYEYTGSRHNTSSYDINPLTSGVCYFTFEVPNYFETSGDSISVVFTINDVPYEILIRDASFSGTDKISRELILNEKYVSNEHGEITLKSIKTADSLYPSSTSGYYTYYSAEEGQVFIIAEFDVKYLGNEDITAKRLLGGYAIFNGNKYTCQCIPESSMAGIVGPNIEFNPLAEDTIYLIFSIPENAVPQSISYELNLSGFSLEITDYAINDYKGSTAQNENRESLVLDEKDDVAEAPTNNGDYQKSSTYFQASIDCGANHTVGLKSDGTVVAVGYNLYGECNVEDWTDIIAVSAASRHTVGLKSGGTVVAVGSNGEGQCNVEDWTDIIAISAGLSHTVGLKSDGTVVAVGYNDYGKCDVEGWTDIVAVSAGGHHTVGLKSNGTVVAVGYNNYDQCNVEDWTDIIAISAGETHTVGLKSDGTVVAVGDNYGKCDVEGWTDIVAVSAGLSHTVGLKYDGTVIAVRNDNYWDSCNVEGWTDIIAISAGDYYTVGLKADGTVVAVGHRYRGKCDVEGWTDIFVKRK